MFDILPFAWPDKTVLIQLTFGYWAIHFEGPLSNDLPSDFFFVKYVPLAKFWSFHADGLNYLMQVRGILTWPNQLWRPQDEWLIDF